VTSQYLRALMQKKMACKSEEERGQLCDRLLQDASQLRELFCGLVRGAGVLREAGAGPQEGKVTSHRTARSVQGARSSPPSASRSPPAYSRWGR